MELTIDDLLNALQNPNQDDENKLSAKEIWDMIANQESYDKMGFSSDDELKEWMENNPYSNL